MEYNLCLELMEKNPAVKAELVPEVETLYTPIMVTENKARMAKSNYSYEEWAEISQHEKGLILALYNYENMSGCLNTGMMKKLQKKY